MGWVCMGLITVDIEIEVFLLNDHRFRWRESRLIALLNWACKSYIIPP